MAQWSLKEHPPCQIWTWNSQHAKRWHLSWPASHCRLTLSRLSSRHLQMWAAASHGRLRTCFPLCASQPYRMRPLDKTNVASYHQTAQKAMAIPILTDAIVAKSKLHIPPKSSSLRGCCHSARDILSMSRERLYMTNSRRRSQAPYFAK